MSGVLYSAYSMGFSRDVLTYQFIPRMEEGAHLCHVGITPSEKMSWDANSREIKNLIELASLPADTYVSFEYRVPHEPMRIDCMLYGKDSDGENNVIHLELKQWSNATVQELYPTGVFDYQEVEALTGRHFRTVAHPSQQVEKYQEHLENYVAFFEDECHLKGMAYCYNYRSDGVIICEDMDYDAERDCLVVIPGKTHSAPKGDEADKYIRNIYRVLMSRGKRGCFVYSCNPGVAEYL